MANWPDSPSWSDPKMINAGNQYNAADGVLYTDMNKIISNLLYLKQRGGIIPTGTLSIVSNDTYDVTKYARVEVNVPQTGGGDQPQLNAPTISIVGTTLSIEDPTTNGNFTSGWKLYDDGAYIDQFLTAVVQLANIQFSTGTHKLTVKSFGTNFKDSAASNEVTYQITEKLAAPVVTISGSIISWGLVPNASGYLISYTGATSGTQSVSAGTSSYDLEGLLSTSGTYAVTVTAKGTGDYTNSDPSNTVTYTNQEQLATPQNVTADGTTVSWDPVEHAETYDIYVDGTFFENTDGGGVTHSETWVMNSQIETETEFNANISFKDADGDSYSNIAGARYTEAGEPPDGAYGISFDGSYVYNTSGSITGWHNEAYRTITFLEEPTGDLLTWLQANGTKQ